MKMKLRKYLDKSYLLIFVLLFIYLFMQYRQISIYYDDYGYLSLSYGANLPDVVGHSYSLFDIFHFMYQHFINANGRLLYTFLFPFCNMVGGLRCVQAFMTFTVFYIFYYIFKEIKNNITLNIIQTWAVAIFVCLQWGLINIMYQRFGSYWFAASFIYITPTITFLLFSKEYYGVIQDRDIKKQKGKLLILAFLTSFSTEQWFVATLSFSLMAFIYKMVKRIKICKIDLMILGVEVLGGMPILLSPAVSKRINNNTTWSEWSLAEKLCNNVQQIIDYFFHQWNKNYLLVFLGMLITVDIYLVIRKKLIGLDIAHIVASFLILYYLFFTTDMTISHDNIALVFCLMGYVIISCFQFLNLFWNDRYNYPMFVFISALGSLGCMIVVPELPLRCFLPFMLLSFYCISYLFAKTVSEKFGNWYAMMIIFVGYLSIPNMKTIYQGYRTNYLIQEQNDRILNGNYGLEDGVITVSKLDDVLYGGEMLYYDGFSKIKYWMCEYYNLSPEVEIIYE